MNIATHENAGRFRQHIEDEIERLIAMLDAMEPDPDLEDGADSEPWLGWSGNGSLSLMGVTDDREQECEDEGAQVDEEYSCGWSNEGSQGGLNAGPEAEPELGWTEEIDQTRNNEQDPNAWLCQDGEPDLGFVGHGTGHRPGETTDDREGNLDDREGDVAEVDAPGFIAGGNESYNVPSCAFSAFGADVASEFDGSGYVEARNALRKVLDMPPLTVEREYAAQEKCHVLPNGDIFRTAVPANFVPARATKH